jgi:hypothetical protein
MVANTVINVVLKRQDKIYQLVKVLKPVHLLIWKLFALLCITPLNVTMVVFIRVLVKQLLQDNPVAVHLFQKMFFVLKNTPLYHVPMVANMTINVGLKQQDKI